MLMSSERLVTIRSVYRQLLLVILINVPTVSFGLALGWVSLASGEAAEAGGEEGEGAGAVVAAVTTFAASSLGVPISARALRYGRKFAVIATSFTFVICWSLKLVGGPWCMVAARTAAGLGAAGAWALAPLLAREMCSAAWGGAAAAAVVPAHNLGVLLMYLAADARLPHATVLWWCLGLSVSHCFVFMLMPESPAFLAASGKLERSLRWLRGSPGADGAGSSAVSGAGATSLKSELAALPSPDLVDRSAFALAKDMLSDKRRRRAFFIGGMAVVGQEACGVLALLQYAERVFVLAERGVEVEAAVGAGDVGGAALMSPARHAVILGVVQLAASFIALYFVERVGRRPLIVWSALCTGLCLAAGAALVARPRLRVGGVRAAGLALAAAVAADSAGLQPAPYALLADMFHYEFRSCAVLLVTAAAGAGNALEVCVFPLVARSGGLQAAVALAAAVTLAYAAFAFAALPETRRRTPQQIYDALERDTLVCTLIALLKRFTKRTAKNSSCPEKGTPETKITSKNPTIIKRNISFSLSTTKQSRDSNAVNIESAINSDVTLHTITNKETENTNL
ncbi:unnamed protein product [Parnassius apollo]|uniref:(apollo) hypothetical protein n=1 Tax=Parnassius apollo TaxID=110799 RepID=A0A8S3WBU2_PARAO|nr:unnamed protein product [Parnassius apollo]